LRYWVLLSLFRQTFHWLPWSQWYVSLPWTILIFLYYSFTSNSIPFCHFLMFLPTLTQFKFWLTVYV
jgi:hypothetical protein